MTHIADLAFANSAGLTDITFPASVTHIGERAFSRSGLASIDIHAGVESIGVGAFASCSSMIHFGVHGDNPFFRSLDGTLFDHSGVELLQCPGGMVGTYTVPEGVEIIQASAFDGCVGLIGRAIPGECIAWCCRSQPPRGPGSGRRGECQQPVYNHG